MPYMSKGAQAFYAQRRPMPTGEAAKNGKTHAGISKVKCPKGQHFPLKTPKWTCCYSHICEHFHKEEGNNYCTLGLNPEAVSLF